MNDFGGREVFPADTRFGTNYDNLFAPGQLFVNKRGVRKSGWEAGTSGKAASWVSRYGSVTISCAGYQLAWGGMNEAGLVFSTFSRLADGMAKFPGGSAAAAVDHAFGLLAGVSASITRWSFVCDAGSRVFYLKSYKNPKVRFVDLKQIDFSFARPTAMLDAHSEHEGDMTGAFREYSHDIAAAHMIEAMKYFRPGTSPALVRRVLALFESFSCKPERK